MSPAEMRRRYDSGESLRALARAAGVAHTTVRRMLMQLGVERRPRYQPQFRHRAATWSKRGETRGWRGVRE